MATNCGMLICRHYKQGEGGGSCEYCKHNPDSNKSRKYNNYEAKSYKDYVKNFTRLAGGDTPGEKYGNAVAMAKMRVREIEAEDRLASRKGRPPAGEPPSKMMPKTDEPKKYGRM